MKIKVGDALVSHQALTQLGQAKWPFQASIAIAKNKAELTAVGKEYEERRQALVQKYGKKGENGVTQVDPAKLDKFQKEVMDIQSQEVELDLKTVSMADLKGGKKDDPDIEPNILEPLLWMITMQGQRPTRSRRK